MAGFGWTVLALVFLDEVLLLVSAAIFGAHRGGVAMAVLLPLLVIAIWWSAASPKARFGAGGVRPVVKIVLFTLGVLGLWAADHHGWAIGFGVFTALIHALAVLPGVRELVAGARSTPTA